MNKTPSRDELLEELESIHNYLSEPESASSSDHIPVLTQALSKQEKNKQKDQNTKSSIPEQTHNPITDKKNSKEAATVNDKKTNASSRKKVNITKEERSENPFLPPHIRKRLSQNKDLISEIQKQAFSRVEIQGDLLSGFETDTKLSPAKRKNEEKIVDELVAEFLPKIETRLRAELLKKLHDETK